MYLPDEVWLVILQYLDYPDLSSVAHSSWRLRRLALDPSLIHHHIHTTAQWLSTQYPVAANEQELNNQMKTLCARHVLMPRLERVPINNLEFVRRILAMSWQMRRERLQRRLQHRPSREDLVARGIIRCGPRAFASTHRALERQRATDVVNALYAGAQRPSLQTAIRRGIVAPEEIGQQKQPSRQPVRVLARMFSRLLESSSSSNSSPSDTPTRARVYHLKRLFEGSTAFVNRYAPPDLSTRTPRPLQKQRTGVSCGLVQELRAQFDRFPSIPTIPTYV